MINDWVFCFALLGLVLYHFPMGPSCSKEELDSVSVPFCIGGFCSARQVGVNSRLRVLPLMSMNSDSASAHFHWGWALHCFP